MKRVIIPELLDTDSGTPQEIADTLLDLRGINQKFGGITTTKSMVEHVSLETGIRSFTVLEVAAGGGYVPEAVRRQMMKRGIQMHVTLLDRAHSHLPSKMQNNSNGDNGQPPNSNVVGDALALPFRNESFDLIGCGLFAHHLSCEELISFVNEGLRVCRVAVLINDVVRSPLHLGLVYAASPLFRSRMTRHDAVASVRMAYTPEEMAELLERTSAAVIKVRQHYLFRMGVIAWKSKLPGR